jgi:glycerol-3-phosphate dehydrogenase (NAD(P)+)
MQEVCILGAGAFGTALAQLCARQGQRVTLWMRNADRAAAINKDHRNPDRLSEFPLSWKITATTDLEAAVERADWMIIAIPSQVVRPTLRPLAGRLREVVLDVLGADWAPRVLALSGPSFAREIMEEHPTAVVLACQDEALADEVSRLFFCDHFRAYCTTDVVGVELGGALKNIMAIAAGGITGMGLGDNSRAALVTRGVAEITRLAVAKGADPLTLAGLAGVGDVLLTCTGALSRNRAVGQAMGEGLSLEQALERVGQVAEGVETTRAAKALADQLGVEARIINAVYRVLFEAQPVRDALIDLVRREPGRERD